MPADRLGGDAANDGAALFALIEVAIGAKWNSWGTGCVHDAPAWHGAVRPRVYASLQSSQRRRPWLTARGRSDPGLWQSRGCSQPVRTIRSTSSAPTSTVTAIRPAALPLPVPAHPDRVALAALAGRSSTSLGPKAVLAADPLPMRIRRRRCRRPRPSDPSRPCGGRQFARGNTALRRRPSCRAASDRRSGRSSRKSCTATGSGRRYGSGVTMGCDRIAGTLGWGCLTGLAMVKLPFLTGKTLSMRRGALVSHRLSSNIIPPPGCITSIAQPVPGWSSACGARSTGRCHRLGRAEHLDPSTRGYDRQTACSQGMPSRISRRPLTCHTDDRNERSPRRPRPCARPSRSRHPSAEVAAWWCWCIAFTLGAMVLSLGRCCPQSTTRSGGGTDERVHLCSVGASVFGDKRPRCQALTIAAISARTSPGSVSAIIASFNIPVSLTSSRSWSSSLRDRRPAGAASVVSVDALCQCRSRV